MDLQNSKRILFTANYVTTQLTDEERASDEDRQGRAIEKLSFLKQLKPTSNELRRLLHEDPHEAFRDAIDLAMLLTTKGISRRTAVTSAARLPPSVLIQLGDHLADLRDSTEASAQTSAFRRRMRMAPVGRLHLERIEMYPVGMEKGELVFTVPLAPKETITISHKEWSTSGEEYERIVQDYFESYSERGVAEKTDFSAASENERKHANAFDFGASHSARSMGVTVTVTLGLKNSSEARESAKQSMQHNREVTEKASARSRQEHKISVKLETKRGLEDSSYRTISNPHSDRALRIDYFRMMRKWRTDLLRYGLRETFDLMIPNPGGRLWAQWRRLNDIDRALETPFVFPLKPEAINRGNIAGLADTYGATGSTPVLPPDEITVMPPATLLGFLDAGAASKTAYGKIDIQVPAGYVLKTAQAAAIVTVWPGHSDRQFKWLNGISTPAQPNLTEHSEIRGDLSHLYGLGGALSANYLHAWVSEASMTLSLTFKLTEQSIAEWQVSVWKALRDASFAKHQEAMSRLQRERDKLFRDLLSKDTLTLRRMERDELMRHVLYWMLGTSFEEAPGAIEAIINDRAHAEAAGQSPATLTLDQWGQSLGFGDDVKFLHQAIEWENLLYFLYPYFWGSDALAREKLLFDHPDPIHRDFLRAGYARVVIPVRPGFEKELTRLLDTGLLSGESSAPYVTVAEDIQAFARTNYAGIPPANPEKHARPLLYPKQRETWDTMQKAARAIEKYFESNKKYPVDLSVLDGSPFVDAWGRQLVYASPGTGNDFDLISLGANGVEGGSDEDADISLAAGSSLVASWFDYTPSSGIDIELNEKYDSIA